MDNLKRINLIGDILYHDLLDWGLQSNQIEIEEKQSKMFLRKIITAEKEGIPFKVVLEVKMEHFDDYYTNTVLNANHHFSYLYTWSVKFYYYVSNPYNVRMTLEKETLGQKIGQLFSNDKIKVYNKAFDKTFSLQCNHKYAYAAILNQEVQEKILEEIEYCSQYSVLKDRVRYATVFDSNYFNKNRNCFIDLMEVGLLLAKNIENWQDSIKMAEE